MLANGYTVGVSILSGEAIFFADSKCVFFLGFERFEIQKTGRASFQYFVFFCLFCFVILFLLRWVLMAFSNIKR